MNDRWLSPGTDSVSLHHQHKRQGGKQPAAILEQGFGCFRLIQLNRPIGAAPQVEGGHWWLAGCRGPL